MSSADDQADPALPSQAHETSTQSLLERRRIFLGSRSARQHVARGAIINSAFSIALALVALLRGFAIARFLTRADYGVWGIVIASLGTLMWLKHAGIGDKYLQQNDPDEELAFQRAFTMECIVTGAFGTLFLVVVPLVALAYGQSQLLLPGLALGTVFVAGALQAPSWIYYRQMRFTAQRFLLAIDPVVGTVVALSLAVAGAGYWAPLGGVIAGAWMSALVTVKVSPYRLRFRLATRSLRSYLSFSWPLFVASACALVIVQSSLFFGNAVLGLAGAGAMTLAANISAFAQQADALISGTMYPIVCAVQERIDLLYESFVKSNRVALMWAVPFGLGLVLFAPDLVRFGIGLRWLPAVPLLQVFGLTEALGHLAFNWDDYFRARGDTRPMAWAASITTASFLVVAIPLLYVWGLPGFAVGVGVQMLVNVACRVFFLRRMFDGFDMLRHAVRACGPTLPGIAVVLLARAVEPSHRTLAAALAELIAYSLLTVFVTWALERPLLREVLGYLRRSEPQARSIDDLAPAPAEAPGAALGIPLRGGEH